MYLSFPLIILIVIVAVYFLNRYLTYTPHGPISLKSGLVLKVLKEYKGDDIFEVRRQFEKMSERTNYEKKLPITKVINDKIPCSNREVPVRIYHDKESNQNPIIIFIHGGGWCIGDLNSHDQQCRRIALETGYPVISVEYQLSPEVKYPVALNEITEVIEYIIKTPDYIKADENQIILMGDSAGGNLAITSALKMIELGYKDKLKSIVPIYPVIDCHGDKGGSYKQFDSGLILTEHLMTLFSDQYIPENQDLKDPYLSPIYSDKLSELPPCFVLTAGFDPLRDEGELFANKLKSLGNTVLLKRYDNSLHSFFGQAEFGQKGLTAVEDINRFIKDN